MFYKNIKTTKNVYYFMGFYIVYQHLPTPPQLERNITWIKSIFLLIIKNLQTLKSHSLCMWISISLKML
jgi:hypothetical protein